MKALVTGSGGLVGSACVRGLAQEGWQIIGLDNDMRQEFFGPEGSTASEVKDLCNRLSGYRHYSFDLRDRLKIRDLLQEERPAFIIHTAAQPSHDKAAAIPYDDFDINAVGTLNLLVAARDLRRLSILLHQHEQGLRRPAQHAASERIGDPVRIRRWPGWNRREYVDRRIVAFSFWRFETFGGHPLSGIWTLFQYAYRNLPLRLSYRPASCGR